MLLSSPCMQDAFAYCAELGPGGRPGPLSRRAVRAGSSIATRSTRSMPLISRSRACARWRASRCLAKSACNGGATSCAASAAGRRAPIRSRPRCLRQSSAITSRRAGLIDLVEARRFDLYDEPMAGIADLEAYARRTSSGLFALAAQILAGVEAEAIAEPAGIAYAIAGLLRAFPLHAARHQLYRADRTPGAAPGANLRTCSPADPRPGFSAALAELRNLARRHLAAAHEAHDGAAPRGAAGISSRRVGAAVARSPGALRCLRARRDPAMAAAMADLARGAKSGADRGVRFAHLPLKGAGRRPKPARWEVNGYFCSPTWTPPGSPPNSRLPEFGCLKRAIRKHATCAAIRPSPFRRRSDSWDGRDDQNAKRSRRLRRSETMRPTSARSASVLTSGAMRSS